jgi:hypothetical protein
MRHPAYAPVLSLATALAFCAGCGDSAKMAPVTGVVSMNGRPVEGVAVVFTPQPKDGGAYAATKPSSSFTDGGGRYSLSTKKVDDGAAVGKHIVTILAGNRDARPPGELPPGYVVEVEPGKNTIDLELQKAK